jgi:anti-sigma-K factor RskA
MSAQLRFPSLPHTGPVAEYLLRRLPAFVVRAQIDWLESALMALAIEYGEAEAALDRAEGESEQTVAQERFEAIEEEMAAQDDEIDLWRALLARLPAVAEVCEA